MATVCCIPPFYAGEVVAGFDEPATTNRDHEARQSNDGRFTCCHPALPPEGQAALTLHQVCGLTTEESARAFLVQPATLAQRIMRAKAVLLVREELAGYYPAHSARADLCRRVGRLAEARDSYEKALALVRCKPERRSGQLRDLQ